MPPENEIIEGEEKKTVTPPVVDAHGDAIKDLTAKVEAQAATIAELQKPVVPKEEPKSLPAEYSPEAFQQAIDDGVAAQLQPITDLVAADRVERNMELRDGLIGLVGGITDLEVTKMQQVAQKQFDSGAASNMEEAVNNAKALLGIKSTPNSQADEARRAGRRGAPGRAPTQSADFEDDDAWLKANVPDSYDE